MSNTSPLADNKGQPLGRALQQAFPLPTSGRFSELINAIDEADLKGSKPTKPGR